MASISYKQKKATPSTTKFVSSHDTGSNADQFSALPQDGGIQIARQQAADLSEHTVQMQVLQNAANQSTNVNKDSILQRKATRAERIASAMGTKHGVDTSSLKFNHNSSFPASVNASATIQGNSIHLAPGADNPKTIKHEVGHYIDNVKHGTPKGDTKVNGYVVDTTREKAADRMANASLNY